MISVAILGAGIGAEHFKAYRHLPDQFDVLWIIDQNRARAELLAQDHTRVCSDIQTALQDPAVDLIDICLPPHLHVPTILDALAAGKHVICEKPIATALSDVTRITQAADENGRLVFPVFQYRFAPAFAALRHLIDSGFAGRPISAALETHWNRGADYYAVPWRGTWAGEQGGAVLGHAIHNHDLLTHFMGPVAALSASTRTLVNNIETEDCAAIGMELTNGALVTSSVTLGAAHNRTRLRFVFENLTATSSDEPYAPGTGPWEFSARNPGDQQMLDELVAKTPPQMSGFEGFFAAAAAALSHQPNDAVTLQDGAASIELVTAIYHAARTGQRVALPIAPDHPLYRGWTP